MKLKKVILENKKIHSQEKFARQNFSGIKEIGKEIKKYVKDYKKFRKELSKKRNSGEITKEQYFDAIYNTNSEHLKILFDVLKIKMTNTVGHALNGRSTKTLKDIVDFMDEYGVGDRLIYNAVSRIAKTRRVYDDDFITLSAIVAAQAGDLDFIKRLEEFGKKNKSRENSYSGIHFLSSIEYTDMSRMTSIRNTKRVALEALVNGHKDIYGYMTDNEGLDREYILKYIEKGSNWYGENFTKKEINNVIQLEPDVFDDVVKNMPENLPDYLEDIFLF